MLVWAPLVLADGCKLERISEVPMSVTSTGQVVVPVEINGIHVKMAVDTASSLTNIYSGATAALNLKPADSLKRGVLRVGATNLTQTVHINSLNMAKVRWEMVSALVYPWNKQYTPLLTDDDVVGSLGQSMFAGVDLELDFGAHKLRVYTQKHCPGDVVYWSAKFDVLPLQKDALGDLYIAMMANGMRMEATMATMSTTSAMEEDVAKKLLGLDRTSAGIDAAAGSDGCSNCGSITLQAQGLEIRNARVRMVRTISPGCHFTEPGRLTAAVKYDCAGAFPLHLGMNVLSKLHLYFANGEKKLYFTDANAGATNVETDPPASDPGEH